MSQAKGYTVFSAYGGTLTPHEYDAAVETLWEYNQQLRDEYSARSSIRYLASLTPKQREGLYQLFASILAYMENEVAAVRDFKSSYIYTNTAVNLALMWPSSLAFTESPTFADHVEDYTASIYPLISDPRAAEREVDKFTTHGWSHHDIDNRYSERCGMYQT